MQIGDSDDRRPPSPEERARYEAGIEAWLTAQQGDNPLVEAVEADTEFNRRSPTGRRWHVRLLSDEKGPFTIRLELDQRTLAYETYFCPGPMENQADFFHHLLVRNAGLYGAAFCVGEEDAIFLRGRLGLTHAQLVDDEIVEAELDRIVGSLYQWTDQFFRPAMRIGFASRLTPGQSPSN